LAGRGHVSGNGKPRDLFGGVSAASVIVPASISACARPVRYPTELRARPREVSEIVGVGRLLSAGLYACALLAAKRTQRDGLTWPHEVYPPRSSVRPLPDASPAAWRAARQILL